ncbi:hypothetical protein DFQ28_005635 [Apophysomyces sp. BC1034]|nr:hypothetical protein DFQ30_004350 [Apophysomyces sp. BC1015]KAG0176564.1 hypothetical protein DFQ29_005964 [Apophysomyces sp. BC1021]KAG0187955.1 hypothetical protein DFQ28_005635 [Apophysomyces sp. BC1034]
MISSENNRHVTVDKTRRKRLKVVSACGECRRKKTKCDGQVRCQGCIKANVECKYTLSSKGSSHISSQPTELSHGSTSPSTTTGIASTAGGGGGNGGGGSKMPKPSPGCSVEAIEERLSVIEDILRALLDSGKDQHLLMALERQGHDLDSLGLLERDAHRLAHIHSGPSCGDMYHPHPLHASQSQNSRRWLRQKRPREEDDGDHGHRTIPSEYDRQPVLPGSAPGHGRQQQQQQQQQHTFSAFTPPTPSTTSSSSYMVRLPPLHNHHARPQRSCTSPSSSSSASPTPGTPAIRNLLNNEEDAKVILPSVSSLSTPPLHKDCELEYDLNASPRSHASVKSEHSYKALHSPPASVFYGPISTSPHLRSEISTINH